MASVVSKTTALRSLLMRAWRERWSDIQWGIHLKTVLPRGCSGDAYNLSSLILQQALVAAVPNELILSFLRHSLAAQTVSYAALLDAIALFGVDGSVTQSPASSSDGSDTSATPKKIPSRPHCVASLLDLIEASQSCMTSRGKPEECVALASSTLKVTLWLLKTMNFILEVGEKVTEVDSKNFFVALHLVQKYLQSEFSLSLLYIGKAEDKETYDKVVSMSQQIFEKCKTGPIYLPESMDLKQEVLSMVNGLSNVDPSRGSTNLTSMIHAIQPMLIYEAILRPTSDLGTLSYHLHAMSVMHNISFVDLVFEIIRCLLVEILLTFCLRL